MKVLFLFIFILILSCGYPDIDSVPKFRELNLTDKELFDLCELKSTDNNKIETCIKEKKQNK